MLLAGSPAVQPQRVLDQDALARVVLNDVESDDSFAKSPTIDDVAGPTSIPVEAGREFECNVVGIGDGNSSGHAWVKVKIKDDQGTLSLDWAQRSGPRPTTCNHTTAPTRPAAPSGAHPHPLQRHPAGADAASLMATCTLVAPPGPRSSARPRVPRRGEELRLAQIQVGMACST
ncbi:hypothetical protein [Streptomyces sp. NPDC057696]|uniref:hypothetical protein n=1 Tax=Streptomyces sp. NPDC057696 TaxID=3346218 RepID=UPI00367F8AE8